MSVCISKANRDWMEFVDNKERDFRNLFVKEADLAALIDQRHERESAELTLIFGPYIDPSEHGLQKKNTKFKSFYFPEAIYS